MMHLNKREKLLIGGIAASSLWGLIAAAEFGYVDKGSIHLGGAILLCFITGMAAVLPGVYRDIEDWYASSDPLAGVDDNE